MGRLIYSATCSLDGYVNDVAGKFGWAMPSVEVHAWYNDLERSIGTNLYGRRMYDVMTYWETAPTDGDATSAVERDFAQAWQASDKVVYSTTLEQVTTKRTRIERTFDPEAVRLLVEASPTDVSIGGSDLAGQALRAGLVDECHLFLVPHIVGGGTSVFPDGLDLPLELVDEGRFEGGFVHLHYRR